VWLKLNTVISFVQSYHYLTINFIQPNFLEGVNESCATQIGKKPVDMPNVNTFHSELFVILVLLRILIFCFAFVG